MNKALVYTVTVAVAHTCTWTDIKTATLMVKNVGFHVRKSQIYMDLTGIITGLCNIVKRMTETRNNHGHRNSI